jgi:hypothetical protein
MRALDEERVPSRNRDAITLAMWPRAALMRRLAVPVRMKTARLMPFDP